jgi:hypothetical protein
VQQLAGVMVSLGSVGRMDSNDTLIEEATITDGTSLFARNVVNVSHY